MFMLNIIGSNDPYLDYLVFSKVENIVFSFSFFRCWEALMTECLELPFEIGQG